MTRPMARRADLAEREVAMPTEADLRWALDELRDRIREGRAGDEAVALVLDIVDGVVESGSPRRYLHYRRWLRGAGFADDGPEVA